MVFSVLLAIPLLVALVAFIALRGFSLKEFLCTVGVQIVVAGAATGIVRCENTTDTEIWNGVVTRKDREVVSCRHSYQCHCHEECSGSGQNRSCNEECDTCYEHAFDVDWTVHDSTGAEFDMATVDSQGLIEPARWERTVVGEPTSTAHSFTNYVKAAPGTLFRHQGLTEKYAAQLPAYPGNVFDYWRINRFVPVGVSVQDADAWNGGLSRLNGDIGSSKQANIIVVAVKGLPQEFFSALEEAWVGGK